MPSLLQTFPGHLLKIFGLCLITLLMGLAFDLGKQIADANRSDDTPRIWYAKLQRAILATVVITAPFFTGRTLGVNLS